MQYVNLCLQLFVEEDYSLKSMIELLSDNKERRGVLLENSGLHKGILSSSIST